MPNLIVYKTYISDFFYILKITRIMPFCNLFMGRPSYIVLAVVNTLLSILLEMIAIDMSAHD